LYAPAKLKCIVYPSIKIRFYIVEPSKEEFLIRLATTDKRKVEVLGKLGVKGMDELLNALLFFDCVILI
jgi:hypothetical protein